VLKSNVMQGGSGDLTRRETCLLRVYWNTYEIAGLCDWAQPELELNVKSQDFSFERACSHVVVAGSCWSDLNALSFRICRKMILVPIDFRPNRSFLISQQKNFPDLYRAKKADIALLTTGKYLCQPSLSLKMSEIILLTQSAVLVPGAFWNVALWRRHIRGCYALSPVDQFSALCIDWRFR